MKVYLDIYPTSDLSTLIHTELSFPGLDLYKLISDDEFDLKSTEESIINRIFGKESSIYLVWMLPFKLVKNKRITENNIRNKLAKSGRNVLLLTKENLPLCFITEKPKVRLEIELPENLFQDFEAVTLGSSRYCSVRRVLSYLIKNNKNYVAI